MDHILTIEEYNRMTEEYNKVKYKCKCGTKVIIPVYIDKQICRNCGNYVFKNKAEEFKYRVKEKMK